MRAALLLRTTDRVAVIEALGAAMTGGGLVLAGPKDDRRGEAVRVLIPPSAGAWTAVYPERPEGARDLAPSLARAAKAPVLVVGVEEDVAAFYLALDAEGEPIDEYHACPDYARAADEDDVDEHDLARTRGDAAALVAAFGGGDAAALGEALRGGRIERLREHDAGAGVLDPDEVLAALEAALGVPEVQDVEEVLIDAEAGEGDVRRLAWRRPEPPRRRPGLDSLPGLDRLRKKKP